MVVLRPGPQVWLQYLGSQNQEAWGGIGPHLPLATELHYASCSLFIEGDDNSVWAGAQERSAFPFHWLQGGDGLHA